MAQRDGHAQNADALDPFIDRSLPKKVENPFSICSHVFREFAGIQHEALFKLCLARRRTINVTNTKLSTKGIQTNLLSIRHTASNLKLLGMNILCNMDPNPPFPQGVVWINKTQSCPPHVKITENTKSKTNLVSEPRYLDKFKDCQTCLSMHV